MHEPRSWRAVEVWQRNSWRRVRFLRSRWRRFCLRRSRSCRNFRLRGCMSRSGGTCRFRRLRSLRWSELRCCGSGLGRNRWRDCDRRGLRCSGLWRRWFGCCDDYRHRFRQRNCRRWRRLPCCDRRCNRPLRCRGCGRSIGIIWKCWQIREDAVRYVAFHAALGANPDVTLHTMQDFDWLAALQFCFDVKAAERFVDPHSVLIGRTLHIREVGRKNGRCQPQAGQRQEKSNATHVPSFAPRFGPSPRPQPARAGPRERTAAIGDKSVRSCAEVNNWTEGQN